MIRLLASFLFLIWAVCAQAQSPASLVADRVIIPPGGTQLIAEGNVEVFYEGTRVSAARVVFDNGTNRLLIEGPIFIATDSGEIFTATQAELDPALENGLLRGARLILEEQLQLASNRIDRVDGRYTQLTRVAATSCQICQQGQSPLWEIRASRVVHDAIERQLYFDDAQFRVYGLPIFWVPRMRLPDPTMTRATGLLIPQLRTTDLLGVGIKLPYFIRLGDHRDMTITPYLSPRTRTIEAQFRQAYMRGDLIVDAALSNDDVLDNSRGYVSATGGFLLDSGARLRFDAITVSDDAYLLDYDYGYTDRLTSELSYEHVRDRQMDWATLTFYQSLRVNEDGDLLPPVLIDAGTERRLTPAIGGTLTYGMDAQGHLRTSDVDQTGRDVLRLGGFATWHRQHITDTGIVIEGNAAARGDHYIYWDDSTASSGTRLMTSASATMRYPLVRRGVQVAHLIEPIVQVGWADAAGVTPVNEDSIVAEFDQGNLLSLSRFAGEDAFQTGATMTFGLNWQAESRAGWSSHLTFGRVIRAEAATAFSHSSGLDGQYSDWLLAGRLDLASGLSLDARTLIADDLTVTKTEARANWNTDTIDLSATYIFLPSDPGENRTNSVSEWTLDTAYRINDRWEVGFDTRYDVAAGAPSQAGLQIGWQNECVTVDFSVSRRFTSSTTVQPTTDFGLSVGLNGFSAGRVGATPRQSCQN